MTDSNAPLTALLASRPAFGGTSEAEELAVVIDTELGLGRVSWLEVGAGDGANLEFLLDRLGANRTIDAVAIEPAVVPLTAPQRVQWITGRIEKYTADRPFDWVNVRHSAYYMDDAVEELMRLARMLKPGGTLALIHWSQDCVLRRLHQSLTDKRFDRSCAGIENLVTWLRRDHRLTVSDSKCYETLLDVDRVLGDDKIRDGLLHLVLRGRPMHAGEDPDVFAHLLRTIPAPEVRRNGIVLVQSTAS